MFKKGLLFALIITLMGMIVPFTAEAQPSINYALGKPYSISTTCTSNFGSPSTLVTDGSKYSSVYVTDSGSGSEPVSLTVDLKAAYTLDKIMIWHYSADGRTFHNTKTEVSEDNVTWTTVFDSAISAEYVESDNGRIHLFQPVKVRYIRDWINGSDKDGENRWVEIQAFGPQQTGTNVKQDQPISNSLESTSGISLSPGTVALTQDKVGGNYAVKVVAGDAASNLVSYTLTTSDTFNIAEFKQIKVWIKPGAGAQWIKFYTHDDTNNQDAYFKNDLDVDGSFRVGTDVISGKWNQVTLDLSKTSSAQMVQASTLKVETNDNSTWTYDEVGSVYSPVASIDLNKMTNSQTEIVNGELRFKQSEGNVYDTNPTVLVSGKISDYSSDVNLNSGDKNNTSVDGEGNIKISTLPSFTHTDTDTSDFDGTHSNTFADNNSVKLDYASDPYTKLLMHMDGADNGTIFTDEYGKTMTRNGNTVTKTGTKKFGTASAYFDGTTNGCVETNAYTDNGDFNFGSDDFTIDFWVNPTSFPTSSFYLSGISDSTANNRIIDFECDYLHPSNGFKAGIYDNIGGQLHLFQAQGNTFSANTWEHIALVRSGTNFYLFKGGALVASANSSIAVKSPVSGTHTVQIGTIRNAGPYNLIGYIDEFRISKGIARWTSNFTPPSSPYTASHAIDDYTKLLLHADGTDNGTTFTDEVGKTVTRNGDVCTKTGIKKFGTSSAYFDNSGDYLSVTSSSDFNFDTGDFSIDSWIYRTTNTTDFIFDKRVNGSWYTGAYCRILGEKLVFDMNNGGAIQSSGTVPTNQWVHIAIVRASGVVRLYIDGVNDGTKTYNVNGDTTGPLIIGAEADTYDPFGGYIDELRISKGIARWTSNFAPPTMPYNGSGYASSGSYEHSVQDISSGVTANPAAVTFNKTTPDNTSLIVEMRTSSDGGTTWGDWTAKNSGDAIVPQDTDLSNYRVQWRANLSTSDPVISPSLDDVTVSVSSGYSTTSTNTFVSPSIDISSVGSASSSKITWEQNIPEVNGVPAGAVTVETMISTDGGSSYGDPQPATNGGVVPGLPIGTDLSNYRLKYKITLTTTDSTSTPNINDVSINIQGPLKGSTSIDSKISGIIINSGYATASGDLAALARQTTYISSIAPTVLTISGDGNSIYYKNPTDNVLNLLNLLTGEDNTASTNIPSVIKSNYDGTKAAFTGSSNILYLYSNNTTTQISTGVTDFDIQKDGTIYYVTSSGAIYCYQIGAAAPGSSCITGLTVSHMSVPKTGSKVFYSNAATLNSIQNTPNGWKSTLLTTAAKTIDGVWANRDGSKVYFKTSDGLFEYKVSSKSIRSIDVDASSIVNITDDNMLGVLGSNNEFKLYNPNSDTASDIRPAGASGACFDIDDNGEKMAYVASDGLAINYYNGVAKPERYLLSFDGKNSWYSYKNRQWELACQGSIPTIDDLKNQGMTIEEINSLSESDFDALYADGKEIYSIDVAEYFASTDAYTTPSLKGITISLKGSLSIDGASGEITLQKPLCTLKQQDFNSAKWRQIKKIYPVELYPRDGQTYYFITTDGTTYKTYKGGAWQTVDSALLSDLEANWIELTQIGMTAKELRSIPGDILNMLLPADNFTVAYIQKVEDLSTEGYTSQISIDYVEAEFESADLKLRVTLTDGSIKEYLYLTKGEVEDFIAWLSQRQSNKGPIFHKVKTKSTTQGVIQVNEYLNYYMIQYFTVEEM